MRRIAVIGATGMLAKPVIRQLVAAGNDVTAVVRNAAKVTGMRAVAADVFDAESLRNALRGHDAVYVNLASPPGSRPSAPQPEREGLRNIVAAARQNGLRRIAFLSSLVKNYQGQDGFHWWMFDIKQEAVSIVRQSGLPYTIFYPSSFMENFTHSQRSGRKILLAGTSYERMYFIAGDDYGRQVARSFEFPDEGGREYAIQGPQPFTYLEAAREFVAHCDEENLRISVTPLPLIKALGLFSRPMRDTAKIVEALNRYPEPFQSERAWTELGRPEITIAQFARGAGGGR